MAHSLPIVRSAFLPDEPRGRVAKATIRMGSYVGFIKISCGLIKNCCSSSAALDSALAPIMKFYYGVFRIRYSEIRSNFK